MIKRFIPNFVTSLNILSGSFAILLSFQGEKGIIYSALLIFLASIFDFLDGFLARILKASSEIGKQLDSLADVISFGLAPSFIMYQLLYNSLEITQQSATVNPFFSQQAITYLILIVPFLIVILSAIRLAKFNVDTEQETKFIGLPTPALAIFVASLPLILYTKTQNIFNIQITKLLFIFENTYFLIFIAILFSILLVINLPMFSIKFKGLKYKDNRFIYNFLIFSLLLLVLFQVTAIPLIIISYILISVLQFLILLINKKNKTY